MFFSLRTGDANPKFSDLLIFTLYPLTKLKQFLKMTIIYTVWCFYVSSIENFDLKILSTVHVKVFVFDSDNISIQELELI